MVLADPGFLIAEAVEMLDQLQVAVDAQRRGPRPAGWKAPKDAALWKFGWPCEFPTAAPGRPCSKIAMPDWKPVVGLCKFNFAPVRRHMIQALGTRDTRPK